MILYLGHLFFSRMMAQGEKKATPTKQLKKAFHPYPTAFQKFGKTHDNINIRIMKKTWYWRNLKQHS